MIRNVLVVDDDREVRAALAQTLELHDFVPLTAGSFIEAKDHISDAYEGVILSDIRMPGRDGFHLLGHAHAIDPDLPVILLTGEGDVPMAVNAMSQGAFDFLEKPCAPSALVPVLQRALGARALVLENRRLKKQLETGDPAARMLFGTSQLARELRQRVRMAARTGTEVLVFGPAGGGGVKGGRSAAPDVRCGHRSIRQETGQRARPGRVPRGVRGCRRRQPVSGRSSDVGDRHAIRPAGLYRERRRRHVSSQARPAILRPLPRPGVSTPSCSTALMSCPFGSRRWPSGQRIFRCCSGTMWRRRPSRPDCPHPRYRPIIRPP